MAGADCWGMVKLYYEREFGIALEDYLDKESDTITAEMIGVSPIVNALLKIGDRAEIFDFMEERPHRCLAANP